MLTALVFLATLTVAIYSAARTANAMKSLERSAFPYLDKATAISVGIDSLIETYKESVAEGDLKRLDDVERQMLRLEASLNGVKVIKGKDRTADELSSRLLSYNALALRAAHGMLGKRTEALQQTVTEMHASREALQRSVHGMLTDARKDFSDGLATGTEGVRAVLVSIILNAFSVVSVLVTTIMLQRTVRQLNAEIAERKMLQGQLAETSRRAGMAEIATNVLHNVGNAVNSVNVSANLIGEKIRKLNITGVLKTSELMKENADRMVDFIANDQRGKMIPVYLEKLAKSLADEQKALSEETLYLVKCVDHIKDIVATQQSYAGITHVREFADVNELVDDALRINDAALHRHRVSVTKKYAALPRMLVDKSRILMIVTNLISNAKYAMDENRGDFRPLTLTTALADTTDPLYPSGKLLTIRVDDGGIGIPKENLERIFAHGFTTRKEGNGFGLHSSIIAAQEMEGRLVAFSEGPGKGASFTLEIPVDTATVDHDEHAKPQNPAH